MEDWNQTALEARTDQRAFARLAEGHRQWLLRLCAQVSRRYITDSDDEWSVALIALDEAVRGYDESKGDFDAFASVVVRRRVLDHLRREGRHGWELSVPPGAFEGTLDREELDGTDTQVREKMSGEALDRDTERDASARAREEIAAMQSILKEYGFSFFDLADCSPKTEKTRMSCGQAIRCLIASVALLAKMRLARLLPVKELSAQSGVVRKILDRHRRYIIAGAEILDGDFPILAEYMSYVKRG